MSSAAAPPRYVLGIDVGTLSARAGVVDSSCGRIVSLAVRPLRLLNPRPNHYEYESEAIWQAVVDATREALAKPLPDGSTLKAEDIHAVAFDATCSLVLLGENDEPISVRVDNKDTSADSAPVRCADVITWMDHRAAGEAAEITSQKHAILSSLGGVISPEHQIPKLLWLKRNLPAETWLRVRRAMDLTDWLAYKATGVEARSVCVLVCKFTWQAHLHEQSLGTAPANALDAPKDGSSPAGWSDSFFQSIGLSELASSQYSLIGSPSNVHDFGKRIGPLSSAAAKQLGLSASTIVGVGLIDAHAGGVGMIGARIPDENSSSPEPAAAAAPPPLQELASRMAVICGTSTCHMAVSHTAANVPGVWGPFWAAMVPGSWLLEGGESSTGSLLDHIVDTHPAVTEAKALATKADMHLHAYLNSVLERVARERQQPVSLLTASVHLLPYFHGNRSPRADSTLLGAFTGLTLERGVEDLAIKYLATLQALAYGTRHIRETMQEHGVSTSALFLCGGLSKNPLFVQQHADANACACYLPRESDGVLLGAAIAAATAAGLHPSIRAAMGAMSHVSQSIQPAPRNSAVAQFHDRKYKVFLRMYDDQMAYRKIMEE